MSTSTASDGSLRAPRTPRPARDNPEPDGLAPYAPDALTPKRAALSVLAAGLAGAVATYVAWLILKTTNLPAFGTSYVSRAASTAVTVILLLTVLTFVYLWLQDEHAWRHGETTARSPLRRWLTIALCYLSPAGLVVSSLGIPLSATSLYLDGASVDQGFRTQFLTRLTDTARLVDMNYINMPPFYPAGWFWFGGRFANLVNLPGWEAFQPWSLITLATAGCVLVPVWQRITGSLPVATAIALTTTAITLVVAAHEPYAAVIAMGAPAAAVLARRALDGARMSMLGLVIYLGASASMYTLFTAVIALSVVLLALVAAVVGSRSVAPLLRLMVIGLSSLAVAAVVWWPYIAAILSGQSTSSSGATHYLPRQGTEIPLPMFSLSLVGALCMIGVAYLVIRAADRDIRALGLSLVVYYGWSVASMIVTLAGNTLLGFRLETLITLQLATAGVLGIAELRLVGLDQLYPRMISKKLKSSITALLVIVLGVSGVAYAQDIPNKLSRGLDFAYTDTDGNGQRGDSNPPNAARYYGDISTFITDELGKPAGNIVIATDEFNLLSYYPFHGFQGMTAHYANPLGLFRQRNEQLESWAQASFDPKMTPSSFATLLDDAPVSGAFSGPEAFVFRGQLDGSPAEEDIDVTAPSAGATDTASSGDAAGATGATGSSGTASAPSTNQPVDAPAGAWKLDISEDIYPNNPNVRFRALWFNPEMFNAPDAPWTVKQIGPFVVAVRTTTSS
ncbi:MULTISPECIES: arabinofuranosyltransferase [Corynebacterium]|uniref:arabinofuranosyltransferase n=1 Tax=Corynebacterium TaxID=1716 RepID=UPI00124CC245|nr:MULTISPECIES: arabinofuranosyltransferase [Corynebacterium]